MGVTRPEKLVYEITCGHPKFELCYNWMPMLIKLFEKIKEFK